MLTECLTNLCPSLIDHKLLKKSYSAAEASWFLRRTATIRRWCQSYFGCHFLEISVILLLISKAELYVQATRLGQLVEYHWDWVAKCCVIVDEASKGNLELLLLPIMVDYIMETRREMLLELYSNWNSSSHIFPREILWPLKVSWNLVLESLNIKNN